MKKTAGSVWGNDKDGVIAIRAAAAALAITLSEHNRKTGSEEPEAIQNWRDVCKDPDEFSEVRNAWRGDAVEGYLGTTLSTTQA